jgi:hypothetical protein
MGIRILKLSCGKVKYWLFIFNTQYVAKGTEVAEIFNKVISVTGRT